MRRRHEDRHRRARAQTLLFDAWQHVVHALVEPGGQHVLGRDHVERGEPGKPRQHVVVGGPEPARIGGLIGDADHHSPVRPGSVLGQ